MKPGHVIGTVLNIGYIARRPLNIDWEVYTGDCVLQSVVNACLSAGIPFQKEKARDVFNKYKNKKGMSATNIPYFVKELVPGYKLHVMKGKGTTEQLRQASYNILYPIVFWSRKHAMSAHKGIVFNNYERPHKKLRIHTACALVPDSYQEKTL